MNNTLTAIKGIKVGHFTEAQKLSGSTVIVFDKPSPVAYKAYGGASRLYDAHVLDAGKSYFLKHGIFISDGAHAGLESATHIIKALREKGLGWKMDHSINPSITGATVMSLGLKSAPFDPIYGYKAVLNSTSDPVKNGNVGAGTGTSVGKFSWTDSGKCLGMKTGIGSSLIDLGHGALVGALTVVNALGNVIDRDGKILAGNRNDKNEPRFRTFKGFSQFLTDNFSNTTISVVGTNVKVTNQEDLRRIAEIACHGQVRSINPVNTSLDGDTVFAFSTNEVAFPSTELGRSIGNWDGDWWKLNVDILAQYAAQAVQDSIYDACYKAESIKLAYAYNGMIPSIKDYKIL